MQPANVIAMVTEREASGKLEFPLYRSPSRMRWASAHTRKLGGALWLPNCSGCLAAKQCCTAPPTQFFVTLSLVTNSLGTSSAEQPDNTHVGHPESRAEELGDIIIVGQPVGTHVLRHWASCRTASGHTQCFTADRRNSCPPWFRFGQLGGISNADQPAILTASHPEATTNGITTDIRTTPDTVLHSLTAWLHPNRRRKTSS